MMNKAVKFTLLTIVSLLFLGLIAYKIFISSFTIFEEPIKIVLKEECDYESLSKATLYKMPGNASSNPSLHIEIWGCKENDNSHATTMIFAADKPNLNDSDVNIKWVSFDSLIVDFAPDLRLFTNNERVTFKDSTLNVKIIYRPRE
jgi:hypothetical protein